MKTVFICGMVLLLLSACATTNSQVVGKRLLAEQEAKEGSNAEHYLVQEAAAKEHED
jgi:hypothetical protein